MTVHDLLPRLPAPSALHLRTKAFAVLDAVFEPRFRTHVYAPAWAANGAALASMDNGSGDNYSILFDPAGVLILGFDHESAATPWRDDDRSHWPGLIDGVPVALEPYLAEPAFLFADFLDITVCAWYEHTDGQWRCGPVDFDPDLLDYADQDPDGAEHLFGLLAEGTAAAYASFARDCFEVPVDIEVDIEAVARILAGEPLTAELVGSLNADADYAGLRSEVGSWWEIG